MRSLHFLLKPVARGCGSVLNLLVVPLAWMARSARQRGLDGPRQPAQPTEAHPALDLLVVLEGANLALHHLALAVDQQAQEQRDLLLVCEPLWS
jgi:hypothetical protein